MFDEKRIYQPKQEKGNNSTEEVGLNYKKVFGIELPTETGRGKKLSIGEMMQAGKDALELQEKYTRIYGDEVLEFDSPTHLEIIKTLEDAVSVGEDYKKIFNEELPNFDENKEEFLDMAEKIDYSRRKILEKAFKDGLINKEKVYSRDNNSEITQDWEFVSFYEVDSNNLRILLRSNKEGSDNLEKISQREFYKLNRYQMLRKSNPETERPSLKESLINLVEKENPEKVYSTSNAELWWQDAGDEFTKKEFGHDEYDRLFRGYLQIETDDIPDAVYIIKEAIEQVKIREKIKGGEEIKIGFKYLLAKIKDEAKIKNCEQIRFENTFPVHARRKKREDRIAALKELRNNICGEFYGLNDRNSKAVIYAESPEIVQKIFTAMTQNEKLKAISDRMKGKEKMRGEITYQDEKGNPWYGLEYNTHRGHTRK